MTVYTLKQLSDIGVISQQLKRVLVLLGCSTSKDMIELSKDWIKVDYIEKSHKLKDELFKAVTDVKELDSILPEFVASAKTNKYPSKIASDKKFSKRTFKVGDYTEHLLEQSSTPIKVDDLLQKIRYYLPGTYIESIRANLNGDPKGRFIFFLDGYVGLKRKDYDKRFQVYSVENKKIQYAEQRIMEFLSFMEEKHRSPQPHGLEAEESLYRWYLDFTKSTTKELAKLRADFKQYLKEYDQWMFTPFEYSYKRNCDQVKWYVDENLELPTQEDEPELAAWFNSQLECYEKHKDKRKKMFIDLMAYLEDYGMHFYDAKSAKGKAAKKEKREVVKKVEVTPLEKYTRLFESIKEQNSNNNYVVQKALLLIAIGNLIQKENIRSNEIKLTNDLLMEFADICIDIMGTASSFNIAIPFYYLRDESFWSLIPQMWMACEDSGEVEPTYDYIEQNYSCSIIDQDLFELLADRKAYATFKKQLIEDIIEERKSPESQAEDENTSEPNNIDVIRTTTDNESSISDKVDYEERKVDEDGIEHVYVDIPSAEPYKEYEYEPETTVDENVNDIVEDNIIEGTSYRINDFFPLFGFTLGKTTWEQAEEMGCKVKTLKNRPGRVTHIGEASFWDHDGMGVFTSLSWYEDEDEKDFPPLWKSKGFSWDNSYDEWIDIFRKSGFGITVEEQPSQLEYSGRTTLHAEFKALSADGLLEFDLEFDFGEKGYFTSSPNTLFSINVDYLGVNDLFPLYGVTLGKTTWEQARELGGKEIVDDKIGAICCDIDNIHYIYNGDILDEIYWMEDYRDFPEPWKSKGFNWDNSYDEWLDLFKRLGCKIEKDEEPRQEMFNGRMTLRGWFDAISPDGTLSFYMRFDCGEKGYYTSSPNTLYSISVNYHKSQVENTNEDSDKEENVEEDYPLKDEDIEKIKKAFDKKSTSYKYFWFMAILSLINKQRNRNIRYDDILIRMAAIAWPIVIGDNIELGEKDMMPKYLHTIQKKTFIIKEASSNVVESNLSMFYDRGINDILKPLLNNVPYRFLSPWIKYTNNEDVIEKSNSKSVKAPYSICPDSIEINTEWFAYFIDHYDELCSYTLDSFINYAKGFNNNLKLVKLMSSGWGIK